MISTYPAEHRSGTGLPAGFISPIQSFLMKSTPYDNQITRRNFLGLATSAAAATVLPVSLQPMTKAGPFILKNDQFELELSPGKGLACTLTHLPSGTKLAMGAYYYSGLTPVFNNVASGNNAITLIGITETEIEISHSFHARSGEPWIEEEIAVRNIGEKAVNSEMRFGFTLPVSPDSLNGYTFTAVPFRREPTGSRTQYADYTLKQILHDKRLSALRGTMNWRTYFGEGIHGTTVDVDPKHPIAFDVYGSEAWAITNGRTGFLLTKYNTAAMEWAILDRLRTLDAGLSLRWGGAGIYCGDPEGACALASGEEFRFGTTRITSFNGGVTEGFYTFRSEMETRGHGVPNAFNPPLHWNELYDNQLWWLPNDEFNDPEKREAFYRLKDMEKAASTAQAFGCEALYLDPGWDESFASKIWAEQRLGSLADFVALMKSKYGLKVSLHTPLSGWCDPTSYAFECCRLDQVGQRDRLSICGASEQYVKETNRRLCALGKCGVCFFMFDGTAYNGPCWDTQHGHSVPSGRRHHVRATNHLANLVHEKYPDLLVEMHDQVLGPVPARYVPIYLGYGKDPEKRSTGDGFDSIWAFELMWDPMRNLSEGNSICLYYYNLGYSQPLYLHIDLRTDNAEAVVFWWYASTCRHLGIGGTHSDAGVRGAQKKATADYMRLKPHFAAGSFYGIDETIHVHRHPTAATAVINCFNLNEMPADKTFEFDPGCFELPVTKDYILTGAEIVRRRGTYCCKVIIPPMGHRLIEVS